MHDPGNYRCLELAFKAAKTCIGMLSWVGLVGQFTNEKTFKSMALPT